MKIDSDEFGRTTSDQPVTLYTCSNDNGLVLKIMNYGATIVALKTPDRDGKMANVNLGFQKLDGYLRRHPYFGSTVGRFCNRIAKGRFSVDGQAYELATNNDPNHLHGGNVGFDQALWKAETLRGKDHVGVRLEHFSPDGAEGYPGNLHVSATYTINAENELKIRFFATTDLATPVNLTNHAYWNLGGEVSGPILDHETMLAADHYLPVDETMIPTGEIRSVADTIFDFRTAKEIGEDFNDLTNDPRGYDHGFVINGESDSLRLAARVRHADSGRVMEVLTTQPAVQFYTGNFLSGEAVAGGYKQHHGFCLETQHYPDSPNQPSFPNTILRPGETFKQTTLHRFSVE